MDVITEEALIRPSATFSHPSDGRRQNLGRLSPSPVRYAWEKVPDRADEGPVVPVTINMGQALVRFAEHGFEVYTDVVFGKLNLGLDMLKMMVHE